jgi:hypothetical protein
MANPNLVAMAGMYGNNSLTSLSTTNPTEIVSNAASSGKVYKINSLIVTNVDGTLAADVTVNVYSQASLGGTPYAISSTVTIPADVSLIVLDKTTAFYLKENQSIGATAASANDLVVLCSWEEINA